MAPPLHAYSVHAFDVSNWYPISPALTPDGAFGALASLPEGKTLKPVQPPGGVVPDLQIWYSNDHELDLVESANLAIGPVVSAKQSFSSRTVCYDAFLYFETDPIPAATPGLMRATRWGAGFRLTVTISNFETSARVDVPTAAVAADLKLGTASYQLDAYGIADPSILGLLPTEALGPFGSKSLAAMMKFADALKGWLGANQADRGKVQPVPFQVLVNRVPWVDAFAEARAIFFAIDWMKNSRNFVRARADALARGIDVATVERIYRYFFSNEGLPLTADVSGAIQEKAATWRSMTDPA